MSVFPSLNFPPYGFRIAERSGTQSVWDELRGRWLVLTPEEWVRRHALRYLELELGVDKLFLTQEVPVSLHGQPQRADAVAYAPRRMDGADHAAGSEPNFPLILVECKAPGVKIDQACFAQAVRYNSVIGARYLFLTNGLRHYFYEAQPSGDYTPLTSPPDLAPFYG